MYRPPHEPAADGSAHLELVAGIAVVVEEGRDLAAFEALDGELDLPPIRLGADATE